jgi:hypothetical protein
MLHIGGKIIGVGVSVVAVVRGDRLGAVGAAAGSEAVAVDIFAIGAGVQRWSTIVLLLVIFDVAGKTQGAFGVVLAGAQAKSRRSARGAFGEWVPAE